MYLYLYVFDMYLVISGSASLSCVYGGADAFRSTGTNWTTMKATTVKIIPKKYCQLEIMAPKKKVLQKDNLEEEKYSLIKTISNKQQK